jgi:hypothetical protein
MKLKKAKKIESALVVVLEFVRVMASTNPKATAETLQRMGLREDVFAPCVNTLVQIALKNSKAGAATIRDILKTFRDAVEKREAAGEETNLYASDEPADTAEE